MMSHALISLTALALHKGLSSVLLYLAQNKARFSFVTATLIGELAKLFLSLAVVWGKRLKARSDKAQYSILEQNDEDGERDSTEQSISEKGGATELQFIPEQRSRWMPDMNSIVLMSVSALYVLQNILFLYASTILRPTIMQVVWQLRIFTTALASALLLKRRFSNRQSIGLIGLTACVIMINSGLAEENLRKNAGTNTTSVDPAKHRAGVIAAIIACFISGFAGVLAEMVLKKDDTDLWVVNSQMSAYSLVPASIFAAMEMSSAEGKDAVYGLRGFDSAWAWVTVLVHGVSGLLVAFATKYSSSIAKSFSGAFAILITFILSTLIGTRSATLPHGWRLTSFGFGIVLLYASTWLYACNPAERPQLPDDDEEKASQ